MERDFNNALMDKKTRGNLGERLAREYLEKKGYTILAKNYKIYGGEIDIIAQKDNMYIFVEVRFRKNEVFAHPLETIGKTKLHSLRRGMFAYMNEKNIDEENCRLDAIGIMEKSLKDGGGYELVHVRGVEV